MYFYEVSDKTAACTIVTQNYISLRINNFALNIKQVYRDDIILTNVEMKTEKVFKQFYIHLLCVVILFFKTKYSNFLLV